MVEYGGTILVIQETTGINYNTHLKTEWIGYIGDKTLRSMSIAACGKRRWAGLGGLDQSSYKREEPQDESASHASKKARSIEEKERFRWLESLERSTADILEGVKVQSLNGR